MDTSTQQHNIPIILNEIANHLMINSSLVFFSGLLYGKLGISLFFFHYSKFTGNSIYNEYAQYLIDLVKSQIHEDYPLDYERGLAGVGVGFAYLKKHGYYDVDDDFMNAIDSKIIKIMNYEKRTDLLFGFGRYLLSRYESNIERNHDDQINNGLVKLVDLLINHSKPNNNNKSDIISFLYNLFFLDIEKEKIEPYILDSMDTLIKDFKNDPISNKLFTLIRISDIPACIQCRQVTDDILNAIFNKKHSQFDFQWLVQCERIMKEKGYQTLLLKVKNKISKKLSSYNLLYLDELFSNNQDFAFQSGYAGFGLALLSRLDCESISWANLL